jgi:hypothetical protein
MFEGIERIQILAIVGSLFFLAGTIELIRRKQIKEAYALLWLIFGMVFLIFSCWKKGLDYFAAQVGIYYPPAMLFLILILAIILVLVQFSVVISKNNDKIRSLAQEVALLRNMLKAARKNSDDNGENAE